MAEVLGRDVSYRVDFTGSGATAIRKYQLCSIAAGNKVCDLMDASTAAQHSKPAGVAQIDYPYVGGGVQDPYANSNPNLYPVTDKTVTSDPATVGDVRFDGLKGKITLKKRGKTWMLVEVAFGGTLVTLAPGARVMPSDEIDGAVVEQVLPATAGEERKIVGITESNLYKEPSLHADQWASNQVTVPSSAPDPNNVGYVLVSVNTP